MKRLIAALAVLACLTLPAMAAGTEATGSFSWDKNDATRTYTAGFNLDFPITDNGALMIGPAFGATYMKLDGAPSVDAYSAGGRVTLNLTGGNGLFVAATALYHNGDTTGSYTLTPEVGVKFGGEGAFVRLSIARPYLLDQEENGLIDLETLQGVAAIGMRF